MGSSKIKLSKIRFTIKSVPAALLTTCLLSFGLLIPWLGFYWDDWPAVWYLHVSGPGGFGEVFAGDRPLLGALFSLTTPLFGTSIFAWQIFGILARWASTLAFWWFLRSIWPDQINRVTWAALVFAVYPGFKQQYISVTYSHVWIVATTFLLSLGFMGWALRTPRRFWQYMLLSWLMCAFSLFTVEYFFGVELLRPVFIWIIAASSKHHKPDLLRKTILTWIPYLGITAFFLIWRLLVFPSPRGDVQLGSKLAVDLVGTVAELLENVVTDTLKSSFGAWLQAFDIPRLTGFGSGPTALYLVGTLVFVTAAIIYLLALRPDAAANSDQSISKRWSLQAIFLGIAALIVGGIPFWMTNYPIGLEFPWDRFTLGMMIGASLLIAGLLDWLLRSDRQKAVVLGVIIGMAAGMHLQYGNLYRREWNALSQYFWQLVWRAPGIQPGTLLLTAEMPFTYFSDNSLTAPLNWIYADETTPPRMPYLLYSAEARHEISLPDFEPGIEIHQPYRSMEFTGSTSQALVFFYSPPGCLKVVDPSTDKRLPQKPNFISDLMPLSRPDLIIAEPGNASRPPAVIFGDELEHGWCYYFEKAELARQVGDWQSVADFADRAFETNQPLYEVNAPELPTFIEGYAYTGQWGKALQHTQEALKLSDRMGRMLCDTWMRINENTLPEETKETAIKQVQDRLDCTIP
jgi:hypothetical protein